MEIKNVGTILFPSSYFSDNEIDEELKTEYDAAVARNSGQGIYMPIPPQELMEKYCTLEIPYYTIDYAELENGSLHANGCTFTALGEVANVLESEGIETQIFHIGKSPVRGCISCGACGKLGKCAFDDDPSNEMLRLMKEADGIVVGSPVYYAGPNGALCALSGRAFYAGGGFAFKPAAAVVSARRSGTTAAYKIFT